MIDEAERYDDNRSLESLIGTANPMLRAAPLLDLGPPLEPIPKPKFVPTDDQARALRAINDWLDECMADPVPHPSDERDQGIQNPYFVLAGYAGTGKTFCVSELAKSGRFRPSEIVFTAPTNKAVKVLRNYLDEAGLSGCSSRTIFSLLGLSLGWNGEVKELKVPEDPVDLRSIKLIVVDEGSMVNKFLMKAIGDFVQCPVLFMGDPAQLPPVGEVTSPIWKISNSEQLTKVMRYDNAILDLATRLRNVVDHPAPRITIVTEAPVFVLPRPDFIPRALQSLDDLIAGNAKIIAWRNATVDTYNKAVRSQRFGIDAAVNDWLPGDNLVATAQLKNLDGDTFMRTDEEGTVIDIAISCHPHYRDYETFNLLVELESGIKQTIRTLTPTGAFKYNNKLEELLSAAKKPGGNRYWREFYALKEAFHEVRHAYAITTHRSQGSSYNVVFVDREDILLNKNRNEAFRCLYVAVTRARKEVYLA